MCSLRASFAPGKISRYYHTCGSLVHDESSRQQRAATFHIERYLKARALIVKCTVCSRVYTYLAAPPLFLSLSLSVLALYLSFPFFLPLRSLPASPIYLSLSVLLALCLSISPSFSPVFAPSPRRPIYLSLSPSLPVFAHSLSPRTSVNTRERFAARAWESRKRVSFGARVPFA